MRIHFRTALALTSIALMAACGTSSSGGGGGNNVVPQVDATDSGSSGGASSGGASSGGASSGGADAGGGAADAGGGCDEGKACDDGDACTEKDTCTSGKCVGTAKNCDDGKKCTTDSCDKASGCKNEAIKDCSDKIYATTFPCDAKDWKLDKGADDKAPAWAIDDTPGDPKAKSDKCTLNFNNGTDFECPKDAKNVSGNAVSPEMDVSSIAKDGPLAVSFWLAGDWESGKYDNLKLEASTDGTKFEMVGDFDAPDAFEKKTVKLGKYAGGKLWLRFQFNSGDDCISNDGVGPFIDDLEVFDSSCADDAACDDGNPCTKDACDAATKLCQNVKLDADSACDDGNKCTTDTKCSSSGKCSGKLKSCPGGGFGSCTANSCDPDSGECKETALKDGAYCTDGNSCTKDACKAGKCESTETNEGKSCSDSKQCYTKLLCVKGKCEKSPSGENKKDDSYCSDGDSCTSGEACKAGKCEGGKPKDCDDKNSCTLDSCDSKKGCQKKPQNDGKDCDDGNPCTEKTKCDADGKCAGAKVMDGTKCDDKKPCTVDETCKNGSCSGKSEAQKACDDGNKCTKDDKCSSFGSCFGTAKCNDDNGCTLDSCDKDTGTCKNDPKKDGSSCSDSNSCTNKDACKAGKCEGEMLADGKSCSDGDSCTTDDKCAAGACAGTPDSKSDGKTCSDSNPCTVGEKCDAGKCDASKATDPCDDKNACTLDACKKVSNFSKSCSNKPQPEGSKCDDGNVCTGPDTCVKGSCEGKKGACVSSYSDTFECGKNEGWTFEPAADDAKGVVGWAIDKSPDKPEPAAGAKQCTLNFNNGKDYNAKDAGGATVEAKGAVTSKEITVAKGSQLAYWSWHDVETFVGSSGQVDKRIVEVSGDDFKTVAASWELNNKEGKKEWMRHTHPLTKWEGKKIKVRFRFDSVDKIGNGTAGWFIDNLDIEAPK